MMFTSRVTDILKIEYPVVQAGMAGAITTPELVAAVSNSGGLGTLGAGYMSPEQIREAIYRIRELTDKPFGVNLLVTKEIEIEEEREIKEKPVKQTSKKQNKQKNSNGRKGSKKSKK